MPILAGLALALNVICIVHVIRTNRPYYWYFIIMGLPTIGAAIYFFSEMLPDMQHSRAARQAAQDIVKVVDPDREIREATAALRLTDTAENRKRLAEFAAVIQSVESLPKTYFRAQRDWYLMAKENLAG